MTSTRRKTNQCRKRSRKTEDEKLSHAHGLEEST
jgi:hypothetical protein